MPLETKAIALKMKVDSVLQVLRSDKFIQGVGDISKSRDYLHLKETVVISMVAHSHKFPKRSYILEVPFNQHWVEDPLITVEMIVAEVYKNIRDAELAGPREVREQKQA